MKIKKNLQFLRISFKKIRKSFNRLNRKMTREIFNGFRDRDIFGTFSDQQVPGISWQSIFRSRLLQRLAWFSNNLLPD